MGLVSLSAYPLGDSFISYCGFYVHMHRTSIRGYTNRQIKLYRTGIRGSVGAGGRPVNTNTTQRLRAVSRAKYIPCIGLVGCFSGQ